MIEICKICLDKPCSIDNRLIQYPNIKLKEPFPTCDDCKEFWLKNLSDFMKNNKHQSGIYTFENGNVKEISEKEWYKKYPNTEPLRYRKTY